MAAALSGLWALACWLCSAGNARLLAENQAELASTAADSETRLEGLLSVCIPMRDEIGNVDACLRSLLACTGLNFEVLVYDDESSDGTSEKLRAWSEADARLSLVPTRPLPDGWTGKQHACGQMAQQARGQWLLFTDADVRFEPDCLRHVVAEAESRQLGVLSGLPRQEIGSLGEGLLVSLIAFVLWGYLPLQLLRRRRELTITAGIGQFLLVRRLAYDACGGHAGFASDTHDGLYLPRAVRRAGWPIDLTDLTDLASCRMYRGGGETWRGFSRNSFEALGSLPLLLLVSCWHLLGHVGAWWLLLHGEWLAVPAVVSQLRLRWQLARWMRQPLWVVPLHPVSLLAMTAVQWWSLVLTLVGKRQWKGRSVRA